jgi:hypothetical protein
MKVLLSRFLCLTFGLLFFASCNMEQGFMSGSQNNLRKVNCKQEKQNLVVKKTNSQKNENAILKTEKKPDETISKDKIIETPDLSLTASVDNTITLPLQTSVAPKYYSEIKASDTCDNIILKNGDEIKVKVTEINEDVIKYVKCDNLNGPVYSLRRDLVLLIQYANGTKEVISAIETVPTKSDINTRKTYGLSILGFIMSILGWFVPIGFGFVLCAVAFIFGILSIMKIRDNPMKYKGMGLAITSLIIGLIGILLILIMIGI